MKTINENFLFLINRLLKLVILLKEMNRFALFPETEKALKEAIKATNLIVNNSDRMPEIIVGEDTFWEDIIECFADHIPEGGTLDPDFIEAWTNRIRMYEERYKEGVLNEMEYGAILLGMNIMYYRDLNIKSKEEQ